MSELINGLKIASYDSIATVVKILRKYGDWSISEIKSRVENHEYILCFNCADRFGLKTILDCYEDLTAAGISVALYDLNHRETTIEIMRNRNNTYDEISAEIDAEDDE